MVANLRKFDPSTIPYPQTKVANVDQVQFTDGYIVFADRNGEQH